MEPKNKTNSSGIAPLVIFLIFALLATVGYYFLKQKGVSLPGPEVTAPAITSPLSGSKVVSPLVVKGKVPSGWMFEGQLPIKLLDSNRKEIAASVGKETTPGSWQGEAPVDFEGTITFTTSAKSGFLVVGADNPSGLPENNKSFEIPVSF